MLIIIWRFRVAVHRTAFEAAYGPKGEWAKFFSQSPDYLGTELLVTGQDYITIDRWRSTEAYDAFIEEHADDYRRLDAKSEVLTQSEDLVGRFQRVV